VRDISDEIIANSKKLGIDAIITIGGDGSQKIGHELFQKGVKIVGVPKTIDNDLSATKSGSDSTPRCTPCPMPSTRSTPRQPRTIV
jgi:6-phosphofructokinase